MKKYKEILILIIVALPLLILWVHWNKIPEVVAMHWNAAGEVDDTGHKSSLLLMMLLLNLPLYFILLLIPKIDPKKKVDYKSLYSLRLLLHLFMSGLGVVIMRSAVHPDSDSIQSIFSIIGLLFAFLGYYFTKIKHNYFIGIRTPWTLESEEIWTKTHKFASAFWMIGGSLIVLLDFVLEKEQLTMYFIAIVLIISLIPIGYSYMLFTKTKK